MAKNSRHRAAKTRARKVLKEVRTTLKALRRDVRKLEAYEKKLHKQSTKCRPGAGRPKGNSFENAVANMVVKHFRKFGITKEDCYRTPGSGGHRYAKKQDPGDLVISDSLEEMFPFVVECKSYKEINLYAFLYPTKRWLTTWHYKAWLKQCCAAADAFSKRHPLLVFKGNGTPYFAALPAEAMPDSMVRKIHFRYENESWVVVLFKDLLRHYVKYKEHWERASKRRN